VKIVKFILGVLILFSALNIYAITPKETLTNILIFGNGSNMYVDVTMDIHSSRGDKERTLEAIVSRTNTGIKLLLSIKVPAFLNKMKYLSQRDSKGNENRWLGTSRGVRKLSQANSNENIFDSDFTVEDLSVVNVSHFSLSMGNPIEIEGVKCSTIKAVPLVEGYSSAEKIFYIDGKFLWGIDYFDESGNLIKKYRVKNTMIVDGELYPKECIMRTLTDKTSTSLIFNSIDLVDSIPSRIFNRANL